MNKRQKKKQLKKKITQLKQAGVVVPSGAVGQQLAIALEPYLKRFEVIEQNYNEFVDQEVERQAKALLASEYDSYISGLEEFPLPNYIEALRKAGYTLEEDDILVVPDIRDANFVVDMFFQEYYDYVESMQVGQNRGIEKIVDIMGTEQKIIEAMTEHFIRYQTNRIKLIGRVMDKVRDIVQKDIEEYRKEKGRELSKLPTYL